MITFDLVDPTPSTLALRELLVRHGAAPGANGDVIVIDVASIEQARRQLERLSKSEQARTLIVGLSGELDRCQLPTPDSLAGILEEFEPLGVLASAQGAWQPDGAGFIGKRSLAHAIGT